ncbi:hypothetical protein [Cohnella mopanensis]|uniref:hypothetical protein n=1 Tax=Cohnella mopanensis TaxID=2911966 RepID=UPI001EF7C144|nr:hypothetical protein [Cohnella mopanensis]
MAQHVVEVRNEHNINLAFMECFTSCVLTYLNIRGKDYRKILLDYWNLSYQFKTLLSGKEANQLPLEYFYGLTMTFVKGDEESLRSIIRQGRSAICLCLASRLAFFPPAYLGMEETGFQHSILLYGWDERQNRYLVTDPVVDAVASLSPDEAAHACAIRQGSGEIHYFVLEESEIPFSEPDLKSCLAYCTDRNLTYYRNRRLDKPSPILAENSSGAEKAKAWQAWFNNRHGGIRALEHFQDDLSRSQEWTPRRRNDWIVINTKTISSIRRLRAQVWNAYRDTAGLSDDQVAEGQRQIDGILSAWNTVNLLLLKYKIGQDATAAIAAIRQRTEELKKVELQFLEWLHNAVRERGER